MLLRTGQPADRLSELLHCESAAGAQLSGPQADSSQTTRHRIANDLRIPSLRCILLTLIFLYPALPPAARMAAAGDWVDYRQAGRFIIRSEFPLDADPELAAFLQSPDQHEADIVATLQLKPSQQTIVINLFASRREFLQTIREVAPEAAGRRAVFVRGDDAGHVYCYRHAELLTDLRHELTHAILHSMLPFLPLWLDEGLAEYFEAPPAERASGHPSQTRTSLSAKFGLTWRPKLTRLEAKNDLTDISLSNYREAWAWVHFLLHGPPEATNLLQRYLLMIQAEQPPGPLSAHLRQIIPNPEAALTAHLKSWK